MNVEQKSLNVNISFKLIISESWAKVGVDHNDFFININFTFFYIYLLTFFLVFLRFSVQ